MSDSGQTALRIGVDTGGTFTDVIAIREGEIRSWKVSSTPGSFQEGFLNGASHVAQGEAGMLVHSTTVATNALLEQDGAVCALITTRGFGDVLEIGRQNRPDLYDLFPKRVPPIIPTDFRFELSERVDATGEVLLPLDEAELEAVLVSLREKGVESVAVAFLFSFLAPRHEQIVGQRLREAGFTVALSHEILPEFREVERFSTTCANGYVQPVMTTYLRLLQKKAEALSLSPLQIVQSNGGTLSPERAGAEAVRTLLSGPAAGVQGAMRVVRGGQPEGPLRMITFDMGGTSTDVALIDGEPQVTTRMMLGGHPIGVPMMNIHTVGAGGGSLAWVDAGGALQVGPRSAGADPGPACYGRGGGPTVTDAHVVLGHLHPDRFLQGRMKLDSTASRDALQELADRMGAASATEAAQGVLRIANLHMENAIRVISVERGYDPAAFTLVGFGGAGGLHSFALAEALGIPRVLVPIHPGVLSALGAATGALRQETGCTVMWDWDPESIPVLEQQIDRLQAEVLRRFAEDGLEDLPLEYQLTLDMRYRGQSHELPVRIPKASLPEAAERFHHLHEQRYGASDSSAGLQVVTLRVEGILPVPETEFPPLRTRALGEASPIPEDGWIHRDKLLVGDRLEGPCVVVDEFHTVVLPQGWQLKPDAIGNLIGSPLEGV